MVMVSKIPDIAVLLAAYNGINYIEEQVRNILEQQDVNVTLFVSVDKSIDNTQSWFENLSRNDSRVRVLPYGQRFGGAAPNFFRLIRDVEFDPFDYVSFSDQDDIWPNDKLIRAAKKLRLQNADAYSSNVIAFWASGKKRLVCKSQLQKKWDYLFESAGPGCTYVMKKSLMIAIKRCVISNSERIQLIKLHDWFCYAYARAQGYKWYIDPRPSMLYRQHQGNQVGANNGLRAFLYRFQEIASGRGIEQSALIAQLVGKENEDFVLMWSKLKRFGFIRLAFCANTCRRKKQDKLLFFCACLYLAALGTQ